MIQDVTCKFDEAILSNIYDKVQGARLLMHRQNRCQEIQPWVRSADPPGELDQ